MESLNRQADHEARAIALRGFAIRGVQEDNHVTGSWAYTVGMKNPTDGEVTLYIRAAVEVDILKDILDQIGRTVNPGGFPSRLNLDVPGLINDGIGERLQVRITKMAPEAFLDMTKKFGTPVEGNSDQSNYYWVLIADAAGLFPHNPGYIDFFQTGLPADNVGNTPEKSED